MLVKHQNSMLSLLHFLHHHLNLLNFLGFSEMRKSNAPRREAGKVDETGEGNGTNAVSRKNFSKVTF